jgi:hypothetical protein
VQRFSFLPQIPAIGQVDDEKKDEKSLSEAHQHPPRQADRSQTLARVEIITTEAGAKVLGITLGHRGYFSSARLKFCGSFEEFR